MKTRDEILQAVNSIRGIHDVVHVDHAIEFPQPPFLSRDYVLFYLAAYFSIFREQARWDDKRKVFVITF